MPERRPSPSSSRKRDGSVAGRLVVGGARGPFTAAPYLLFGALVTLLLLRFAFGP
jgi:hypothetical protein